jgi:hypothetical protein
MEHPKKSQQGKGNSKIAFFFPQSDQKSVNAGQIIPVFTIVWDDGSQRAKGRRTGRAQAQLIFLVVLMPF